MTANDTYTEPTTGYWQDLTSEIPTRFSETPPSRFGYLVSLPCDRTLVLPLRRLPDGNRAVASLIANANQASNIVVAALADHMATRSIGSGQLCLPPHPGMGYRLVRPSQPASRLSGRLTISVFSSATSSK
jgi:hypothetical protein